MKTTILGRTGLVTTTAGLGSGGFSRIGYEKYGEHHAAGIVRRAYELGVRFFDSATLYGTESTVGEGLKGFDRSSYVISTKFPIMEGWRENCKERFAKTLEMSLKALGTDYIDIYHFHGVMPDEYDDVRELLLPEMLKARDAGKIRFPGITERFVLDTSHKMLDKALYDDILDGIMVGFNIMNPSAAKTVFPKALDRNIGVLNMFAVRQALANPAQMKADIVRILEHGQGGPGLEANENALDFLTETGADGLPIASSIIDAAYRFCMHTHGNNVVLTGTGNQAHLEENLKSLESSPLPQSILEKLDSLFGLSDCVCGQEINS